MPLPVKYSSLARKLTGRRASRLITMESMNDRWLLARMTGPSSGTFSMPSTARLSASSKVSTTPLRDLMRL